MYKGVLNMQSNITFREYQKEDSSYLEDIIRKTWQYDMFCSEKVAKQMATIYLATCLAEQTYTRVALIGNKPVGIIMAKNIAKHNKSIKHLWNQCMCAVPLYLSKEGRATAKIFTEINALNLKILKQTNKNYDGEIAFFAISKECRGMGIGKSLFNMALEYLKEEKVKSYYLYTDSTCNYGFYEHQGMVRCNEATHDMPFKMKKEMKLYLYEGDIHEF
jgi:ribosomal protein S18 acetylase RimI-like enzyme